MGFVVLEYIMFQHDVCSALFINFSNIFPCHHYVDILLTMWLHLIYIIYCFTLLHCNVAPSSFTFDTFFFLNEIRHENYVNSVISIHQNYFGITFIHTLNQPKVSSKQFIYFQFSFISSFMLHVHPNISFFGNYHPCTCGFHSA
jgi:hypothetical protein